MSRRRRPIAWSLVFALVCAFALAAKISPVARAAGPTFIVTKTSDAFADPSDTCAAKPTDCTLREALNAANLPANAGSTIQFEIQRFDPGYTNFATTNHDAWIITPTLALPPLLNDGTIIDGSTQTNQVGNDNIDGPEIIIDGTHVTNSGGLTIQSNGNTVRGIGITNFRANGSPGTLKGVGIEITGDNNVIQGNYVGLGVAPNGTVARPNIDAGIIIYGKSNQIGGDNTAVTTQFNVISGNSGDGILINGGDNNMVEGNYIGTDGGVSTAIPNGGNGINLRLGANGNTIGNFPAANVVSFRNFISGNSGYGIQITNSQNNKIYGNFIGLNKSGTSKIGNGLGGIRIDGTSASSATGNIIGATSPQPQFMRNYIAGSAGPGIQLNGFGASQNQIVANFVGIGSNNLVPGAAPQLSTGILLDDGASDNTVGGSIAAGGNNVVAGISGDGIRVAGLSLVSPPTIIRARNNVVSGNYVGVRPDGVTAQGNAGAGVVLDTYVVNTTIGGATADLRNLIARNGGDGIAIRGTNVTTSTIQKNTIQFNTGNGISILNAATTRVDGGDSAGANQITNNGANGIAVTNSLTTTLQFNTTNLNAQNGVLVSGGRNTNIVSSTLNVNTQNGARVDGAATDVTISGSTIYSNTLVGVVASGAGTQRVKIVDNSMQGNQAGGIDLTPETSGAPGVASNPNHDIDPPFNLHINQAGLLTGKVLTGNSNAACVGCSIQIFTANPQTLDRQGRDKLNVTPTVAPDGTFSANLGLIPAQIALTATDQAGNTSEFAVLTRTLALAIVPDRDAQTAFPGQVITYTHQLVNNGSVDFTNLQLAAASSQSWGVQIKPASPITLQAGQSIPITLTLTLPLGPATNVRENTIDTTIITATAVSVNPAVTTTAIATDTTTVGGKFILAITPLGSKGFGSPKAPNVDYPHTLTNVGNRPGSVTLGATTDLGWTTTITPTSVTLTPGQSAGVTDRVVVPPSTQVDTVANTRVSISGDATAVFTDTTKVLLDPLATMVESQTKEGQGCRTTTFSHTVTNESNGPITFRLVGASSMGNSIKFFSESPNIPLNPDNSFSLNTSDKSTFNFRVEIFVSCNAVPGQKDQVTIGLTDAQNNVIGGASVTDVIHVIFTAPSPRLYLPSLYYQFGS